MRGGKRYLSIALLDGLDVPQRTLTLYVEALEIKLAEHRSRTDRLALWAVFCNGRQ